MRGRWTSDRLLAPFGAVVLPVAVFVALVIVTGRLFVVEPFHEVEIARAEIPVDELEPPDEGHDIEEPQPETSDLMLPVAVDAPEAPALDAIVPDNPTLVPIELPVPFCPDQVAMVDSPVTMKSVVGSARQGAGRREALLRYGGDAGADRAVMRALRWLKTQQLADGSWRAKGEGDATAFALLAFLSHGEDATSREFGPTVMRAIARLVLHHTNNMAAYALAEAAAVVRTPVLSEVAEAAVEAACLKRKTGAKANSGGLLQRYCLVMALKSARLANLSVPALEPTWADLSDAFAEMRDGKADDWQRISGKGAWRFMIGGVCLQYLGRGEESNTGKMLHQLDRIWRPATLGKNEIACCPVRSNYFSTMIFFNAGGELWRRWNASMLAAYADSQTVETGAYLDPDGVARDIGCWRCEDEHIGDQPFWSTCYIAHQLMVYYRYLPTYSKEAWGENAEIRPPPPEEDMSFIEVDI